MVKNILVLILFFYILALVQTSFLAHFTLWGYAPNLILIAVILLNIFSADVKLGIAAAAVGGFFLDVFSSNFIGFWILTLLVISIFINFILKRYVRLPIFQRT